MQNKCEANSINYSTNIIKQCGAAAKYTCVLCNKYFCINCMYLMCNKCHDYITCFQCGIDLKNKSINYCIDVNHDC